MKHLKELSANDALALIYANKKVSARFYSYPHDVEWDEIQERLDCFENGAISYELGGQNDHLKVKDGWLFLCGIKESIESFGASEELENLYKQTLASSDTDEFDEMVNKLCEMYYNYEIKTSMDWIEEMQSMIFNETTDEASVNELVGDFLEYSAIDYMTDGKYIYEEIGGIVEEDGKFYKIA